MESTDLLILTSIMFIIKIVDIGAQCIVNQTMEQIVVFHPRDSFVVPMETQYVMIHW